MEKISVEFSMKRSRINFFDSSFLVEVEIQIPEGETKTIVFLAELFEEKGIQDKEHENR